jgi:hypothetical protein
MKYKTKDFVRFKETSEIARVEYVNGGYIKVTSTTDKRTYLIPDGTWQEQLIEPYSPIEPYRFRNLIAHDYFLVAMAVIGAIAVIVHMALN